MRYEIRYLPAGAEMQPAIYEIICQDNEARALMKEINRELKLMERGRRREMRHRVKDALRAVPHKPMHKRKNLFSFEPYQIDDVCTAARRLIGRNVRAGFLGSIFNITLRHIEDLEAMLASKTK
ncbi:MAG: hypothetical protein PVI75_08400 [Gammaproteobacteria bacterium]|jgi:hypothetical protein